MKEQKSRIAIISVAASMVSVLTLAGESQAAPQGDYFAHNSQAATRSQRKESTLPVVPSVAAWFESFDVAVIKHKPTPTDDVILGRPLNQDVSRLKQWIATASKVAASYRNLAKYLKAMPVPAGAGTVKDFRDLSCDWYNDAALVYEDLIRPRAPFATQEEMQDSMTAIKARSKGLAQTSVHLRAMDQKLRLAYQVLPSRHNDALENFVSTR